MNRNLLKDKELMLLLAKYSNVNAGRKKKARIEQRFNTLDPDRITQDKARRAADIMRKGAFNSALYGQLQSLYDTEKGYRMLCDDFGLSEQTEKKVLGIRFRKNLLSADKEDYFSHLDNIIRYTRDGEDIESAVASVQAVEKIEEYEDAAARLGEGRVGYLMKEMLSYVSDIEKMEKCGLLEFKRFNYLANQMIETLIVTDTYLTEDDWGELNKSLRMLRNKIVDNPGIETQAKFYVSDHTNKVSERLIALVEGQHEDMPEEDAPEKDAPQKAQALQALKKEEQGILVDEDENHKYFYVNK